MKLSLKFLTMAGLSLVLIACGDSPLASMGERSSGWINEPEVVITTTPRPEVPTVVEVDVLDWFNDSIEMGDFETPEEVVAAVFSRRQGDRYIQASRFEIAAALPGVQFPTLAPYGAEWVSSQLVIENSGMLSSNPSAAFGIWSAEPYTRSRSVAQMAVMLVYVDSETASEAGDPNDFSCARFADANTQECTRLTDRGRDVWKLTSAQGITLVWFAGDYRYELSGRTFIPSEVLEDMADEFVPLGASGQVFEGDT